MLFVMSIAMLIGMPEAYAINVTVKSTMMSLTSYHAAVVLPTADIVSLMKRNKPMSIPENEVITSEDTEDYLEEDSEESDYDDVNNDNGSGEYDLSSFSRNVSNDAQSSLALGMLVGSRCEFTCDKRLHHVFCSLISNKCECEKNYPVKIGGSSVCLIRQALQTKIFILPFSATFQKVHAKAVQNVS